MDWFGLVIMDKMGYGLVWISNYGQNGSWTGFDY